MSRRNGLFLLSKAAFEAVYSGEAVESISRRVNMIATPQTSISLRENTGILQSVDFIFSGWGMPKVDEAFLAAAPNLKAIFYAAGAISGWATQAMWDREIVVTTASHANAIPVAEYTLATILFSLKHGWRLAADHKGARGFQVRRDVPGNYGSVIGLIGMGEIARLLVQLLHPFHMKVLVYDPFLTEADALQMEVERVELDRLFAESDVVSLHAADIPETHGLITGKLLASMKPGSTFINTSRGRIVREEEMIAVLEDRPDLQAVLDVTEHEPLPPESPLNHLPNVVLTPHIAGSQGRECQRMGQYMVDELDRYLSGRTLRWQVKQAQLENSVHQLASR